MFDTVSKMIEWKNEVLEIGQVDPFTKKAVHRDILVGLAERVQQNSQWQRE
jgi:hypothetical protein